MLKHQDEWYIRKEESDERIRELEAENTRFRLWAEAGDAIVSVCDCIIDERGTTKRLYYAARDAAREGE